MYRALLHHISFTWVRMQTYPDQMYLPSPTNQCQLYSTLLHQVSRISGSMQTYPGQMDPPPQLTPVLQCPTTPGQLYMWKHTDIPWSDGPPPQSFVQPYWHHISCISGSTEFRWTPHNICQYDKHNSKKLYSSVYVCGSYDLSVW